MRLGLLLALGACAANVGRPGPKPAVSLEGDDLAPLVRGSVTDRGLWFDDAACASQFGRPGPGAARAPPAFVTCVASLGLTPSARKDSLPGALVYTSGPFEIEARIADELEGPRLVWIGYAARTDGTEPPTITSAALESLRTTGTPDGPLDPALAAKLVRDPLRNTRGEYAWLKVCIDALGNITNVQTYEATSIHAANAFVAAANAWTFEPFTVGDRAIPACAMVRPAYPSGTGPAVERLPLPLAPAAAGEPHPISLALGWRSKRIEGGVPAIDRSSTTMFRRNRLTTAHAAFRLCSSATGAVTSVLPLLSTGAPSYDDRLRAALERWVFTPAVVEGQAVPVCQIMIFDIPVR